MEAGDDLAVIQPASRPVDFRGKQYPLGPLTMGQLPAFARTIRPLSDVLGQFADGERHLTAAAVIDLMADHGEQIIEAVSIATRIPRAELEAGDVGDLLHLVPAVLSVNRDFLLGRLPPTMRAAVSLILAVGRGDGQTPSST